MQSEGAALDADAMAGAAESGSMAICEYLLSRQCPMNADVYSAAAGSHHFHILNWLYEHECPMDSEACSAAVVKRHHGQTSLTPYAGCANAVVHCRLMHVRLQLKRELWKYYATCMRVGVPGHLDIVRYVHEQGCTLDASISKAAARGGHLSIVRYLYEHGCVWDAAVSLYAVQGGHLNVLRYLDEHGCPCDGVAACNAAARGGHIGTLRYMHERNRPWDAVRACELAAGSGSVDIINYIVEQESIVLTAAHLTSMLNAAGSYDQLETAHWLRQQGAQWPAVLTYYDTYWAPPLRRLWQALALKWARDQGCISPHYQAQQPANAPQ
jgi:hypothetical protein